MIILHRIATGDKHEVKSIVWCDRTNRFTQKISPNHVPLKMEIKTLHDINMDNSNNNVTVAQDPITSENKRSAIDKTNCPDTGASIMIAGRGLMRRMGLTHNNLHRDKTNVSAAEGSKIKVLGFIPVKLKVKDNEGQEHVARECLYFAEGVITTLVSLGALKNLNCLPANFPNPSSESASSLTETDDEDYDEEKEEVIKPRQPILERAEELPFPVTEENVPKIKAWLIQQFVNSSFNTTSAPLAKMSGIPMKIHIDPEAEPVAVHRPIPIPHHWREQVEKDLNRDV